MVCLLVGVLVYRSARLCSILSSTLTFYSHIYPSFSPSFYSSFYPLICPSLCHTFWIPHWVNHFCFGSLLHFALFLSLPFGVNLVLDWVFFLSCIIILFFNLVIHFVLLSSVQTLVLQFVFHCDHITAMLCLRFYSLFWS